jgi:hypothetical protein
MARKLKRLETKARAKALLWPRPADSLIWQGEINGRTVRIDADSGRIIRISDGHGLVHRDVVDIDLRQHPDQARRLAEEAVAAHERALSAVRFFEPTVADLKRWDEDPETFPYPARSGLRP